MEGFTYSRTDNLIMKEYEYIQFSRRPLSLYLWPLLSVMLFVFLVMKQWDLFNNIVFTTVLILFYYYSFLRYACEIYVSSDVVKIHYLVPWLTDRLIPKNCLVGADYLVSFWDMQSSSTKSRNFKNVCYDTLFLDAEDGSQFELININTRLTYFNKLREYISECK